MKKKREKERGKKQFMHSVIPAVDVACRGTGASPPILGALCGVTGVQGVQLLVLLKGFFLVFSFAP